MCAFWRKTNSISMSISMMRLIFIFGFAKTCLLEQKLRPIKDASMPPDQLCIQIIEEHTKRLRRGVIHTRHCPFIPPLYFLQWSGWTSDLEGMDASLIGRNFWSNKYFLVNPKIKIYRIIEINTLMLLVFLHKPHIYPKPQIPPFFRLLSKMPTPI